MPAPKLRPALLIALALLWLATGPAIARAAEAGTCQGRDLAPEVLASPEAKARVEAAAAVTSNGEAMLWRIARAGVRPSHLFGTVHLSDARVTRLPAKVVAAFEGSRALLLEVADLSPPALGTAIGRLREKVFFLDGRSLKTLLEPAEHALVLKVARQTGLPDQLVGVARPWLVSMMLALSECERARVKAGHAPLDLALAERAKVRGMPVAGLETLDDQLGAMAAVPEGDQITVLRAGLRLHARSNDMVETIVQRYLAREIAKVWPLQAELWRQAGFEAQEFESTRVELVQRRNARMRDAALPALEEGGAFIAVGALHLVGGDGLVALIRASGFEVTAVE